MTDTLKWEKLSEEYGIYIGKSHGFTSDTIALAKFSQPKKGERCADFGTGAGGIPILWQLGGEPGLCDAVEIQQEAADQAAASVVRNGLGDKIKVHRGDIRNFREFLSHQCYDRIACNPPYKAAGAGIVNPDAARRTARHEESMNAEDILKAARFSLKFGGGLFICQRPERLTDFMVLFREYGIEPKRLRFVQQKADGQPSLFLLEGRRGGKPGMRAIEN